jgi:hypothetical protein
MVRIEHPIKTRQKVRLQCGMNMARKWYEHGTNMVRTWYEHGTNMVRITFAILWDECGTNYGHGHSQRTLSNTWAFR